MGEEFCYLSPFNQNEKIFLKKYRILGLMIFQGIFNKGLQQGFELILQIVKSHIEKQQQILNKKNNKLLFWKIFLENFPESQDLLTHLMDIHTALFFRNSNYYELGNRLFSVQYLNIFPSEQKSLNYNKIFWLIILGKAFSLYHFFSLIFFKYKNFQENFEEEKLNTNQEQQQIENEQEQCKICYEKRKNSTLTPCGHVFCWDCILKYSLYKEECPLCRKKVLPREIVIINNLQQCKNQLFSKKQIK